MAAAKGKKYPFLFYGVAPRDWLEREAAEHHYELRFKAPPDAPARLKIARAFEEAVADTTVDSGVRPWLWAGPWALCTVGLHASDEDDDDEDDDYGLDAGEDEDEDGEGFDDDEDEDGEEDPREFLEDMQYALRRVHEVAPLAEVIFCGAREPSVGDPWEKWTLAQQEARSDAPRWGGWAKTTNLDTGAFPSHERMAMETEEDASFEAERRKARKAAGSGEEDEDEEMDEEEADA